MSVTMNVSSFSEAFMKSLAHTLKDWPAWFGYGALNYVGEMVEEQFTGQNMIIRAAAKGLGDTAKQEYFYHLKFPSQAMAELNS